MGRSLFPVYPVFPTFPILLSVSLVFAAFTSILSSAQNVKPQLTLDEFFNAVSFPSVKVSPDGDSVVIETERADWDQQIFRKDLWLYRAQNLLGQHSRDTQSGQPDEPKWQL